MTEFEEESGNQGTGEGAEDVGEDSNIPRNVRMSVGPLGSGEHPRKCLVGADGIRSADLSSGLQTPCPSPTCRRYEPEGMLITP